MALIGSVLRYLLTASEQRVSQHVGFAYGTLAVNVIGCFFIGFLSELVESRLLFTSHIRASLTIGILGGFTTFSAFGNDSMNLLQDGESALAVMNIGVQVLLDLEAMGIGSMPAAAILR